MEARSLSSSGFLAATFFGLTVDSLGRFRKSWGFLEDVTLDATPASLDYPLYSLNTCHSQTVLQWRGPTLHPFRIRAKSFQLGRHFIDTVLDCQEHPLFTTLEGFYPRDAVLNSSERSTHTLLSQFFLRISNVIRLLIISICSPNISTHTLLFQFSFSILVSRVASEVHSTPLQNPA